MHEQFLPPKDAAVEPSGFDSADGAAGKARADAGGQGDLCVFNRWLCITRIRSSVAVVAFVLLMRAFGIGSLAVVPICAVCLGLCSFSYVALSRPLAERSPRLFFHLQNLVDLGGVTIALWAAKAGSATLLLRSVYVLIIVPGSLISIPAGMVVAGIASLCHLTLLGVEDGFSPGSLLSVEGVVPVFLFFLVAQQAFFYGGHLEGKNTTLSQLAARLADSRTRLATLIHIARTLNSTIEPTELVARVNRSALQHLGADWSATFLIDNERNTFRIAALSNVETKGSEIDRVEFPVDSWPDIHRLVRERVIVLAGAEAEQVSPLLTGGRRFGTIFLAGLYRDDLCVGLLALGYKESETPPRDAILQQLTAIADHAAVALRNAQLLEDARQASALKSEFLSMVSHELRTPLNVITGFTEMLRDGAAGPLTGEQREILDRIGVRGRELFDLIEATLHVGRIETGRDGVSLAPVPLADLIHALKVNTAGLPRPTSVSFDWHLPNPPRGTIITDRGKVALVVRNLVSNAFKFTADGGVSVHVLPGQSSLTIVVRDTGVGIAHEQVPLIFEMFRQLENSLTRQHGGVGLGLYIVKQVVDRLEGSITVDSLPGHGTTFSVTLNHYHPDADGDATTVADVGDAARTTAAPDIEVRVNS